MKKLYCYICDYEEWHYCEDGIWYCVECHEPKFADKGVALPLPTEE